MENLRRRTEREIADARTYGVTNFARDIVGAADNLTRAVAAVDAEARANGGEALISLVEGVELTERELMKALEKHGVSRVDPAGEKFDPQFPPGDVRGARSERAERHGGAGDAGRLQDRRARAAASPCRRRSWRSEGGATDEVAQPGNAAREWPQGPTRQYRRQEIA